jgi:glycosyltransferase involved in cell wall biosynthesis
LFYGTRFFDELFLIPFARLLRIPVIRERGEYPFLDRSGFVKKLKAHLYEKFIDRLFDGMIFVTKFLRDYYKPLMGKNAKYIIVPTIVDMARFESIAHDENRGKYIAYCGDPSGNKDGVPILLEAFSLIAAKHPNIRLYIMGDNTTHDILPKLSKRAEQLNIDKRVVFTGQVSREQIPDYLCNAHILALARPSSLQSQGGFAAKIGEYLSTGNPVVVTDVGEIAEFLCDGENAFITRPDSANAFADKLDYALANPELARKVGQRGKEVAEKFFCYKVYGQKIIDFIHELNI